MSKCPVVAHVCAEPCSRSSLSGVLVDAAQACRSARLLRAAARKCPPDPPPLNKLRSGPLNRRGPAPARSRHPRSTFPTGEWTATETILTTNSIDACAGERLVRPWDFRRHCKASTCKTYLFSASYHGVDVATIVPDGRDRYVAVFRPATVPCPHRPGEDAGTNRDYTTITLWRSPHTQILHGLSREHQVGPCSSGFTETSSYMVRRTNTPANLPAEGL